MLNTIVIGATGYAGAELVSLLLRHPSTTPSALMGSSRAADEDRDLADLHPRFRGGPPLPVLPLDLEAVLALEPDAVFLATPHEASVEHGGWLHDRGVRVFDLSAAFRLESTAAYRRHYGFDHTRPDLLETAVYGLADLNASMILDASLVAVPGCYPTSMLLPVRPLVDAGLVDTSDPVLVDSTSGVSGAGRSARPHTSFCEVSLQAYGAFDHRHQPEMARHGAVDVLFTPHLGAYDRGILSTIHLRLAEGTCEADVRTVLSTVYADRPGVNLLPAGTWPSVAAVRGTNRCDLGLVVDATHGRLMISSAIDNLVKGAAGQAVQCLNLACGLPVDLGLTTASSPMAVAP